MKRDPHVQVAVRAQGLLVAAHGEMDDPSAIDLCEPAQAHSRDPKAQLQVKDDKRKAFWMRKRKKQRERDVCSQPPHHSTSLHITPHTVIIHYHYHGSTN